MVLIAGDQADIHAATMWKIFFDHFTDPIQFVTCSELQAAAEVFRYAEGGDPLGEEFVGGVNYGDLTLERGQDQNEELANWWESVHDAVRNSGDAPARYKHDGELILLNWDRTDGPKWDIHKAFPKDFKPVSGLDANNKTSPVMTSIVLGQKHWKYMGVG